METSESLPFMPTSAVEFYDHDVWGEKSGQSLEEFTAMWSWAEANYGVREARNMAHGINVMVVANQHADAYEALYPDSSPIRRKILNGITLIHDMAGLDEALAAEMFREAGHRFGYNPEEVEEVCAGILSTEETTQPKTREEMLAVIGDMDNLAGDDYEHVAARGQQFEQEARTKLGDKFNWVDYHVSNLGRVVNYVMKRLDLDGYERPWLRQVHVTARRMIIDFALERGQSISECAREIGPLALKLFALDRESSEKRD